MIAASRAETPLKPSPDERLIALIIFITAAIGTASVFEKLCEKIHCFAISPPSNFPVVKCSSEKSHLTACINALFLMFVAQ